jgi:hypothetical protein
MLCRGFSFECAPGDAIHSPAAFTLSERCCSKSNQSDISPDSPHVRLNAGGGHYVISNVITYNRVGRG